MGDKVGMGCVRYVFCGCLRAEGMSRDCVLFLFSFFFFWLVYLRWERGWSTNLGVWMLELLRSVFD